MNILSRLEIYPSNDVKGRAVIIGERAALKELGKALMAAADNVTGFETLNLYKSSGHNYEIFITKNVQESEWQELPNDPTLLNFIVEYDNLKKIYNNLKL